MVGNVAAAAVLAWRESLVESAYGIFYALMIVAAAVVVNPSAYLAYGSAVVAFFGFVAAKVTQAVGIQHRARAVLHDVVMGELHALISTSPLATNVTAVGARILNGSITADAISALEGVANEVGLGDGAVADIVSAVSSLRDRLGVPPIQLLAIAHGDSDELDSLAVRKFRMAPELLRLIIAQARGDQFALDMATRALFRAVIAQSAPGAPSAGDGAMASSSSSSSRLDSAVEKLLVATIALARAEPSNLVSSANSMLFAARVVVGCGSSNGRAALADATTATDVAGFGVIQKCVAAVTEPNMRTFAELAEAALRLDKRCALAVRVLMRLHALHDAPVAELMGNKRLHIAMLDCVQEASGRKLPAALLDLLRGCCGAIGQCTRGSSAFCARTF